MTARKRPKVQSFIQSVDPYRKDIFVCTGFDTMRQVKRKIGACDSWWRDWMDEQASSFDTSVNDGYAFVLFNHRRGAGIMRLREFQDTWDFWETLIHELHHYVFMLGKQVGICEELEAQAYLQENLFRSIRRRLLGVDK